MDSHYILPGRLQPPHNDHVITIRRALELVQPHPLYFGLVVSGPGWVAPGSSFEHEAARQHQPERNPFTLPQRLELLHAAVGAALAPDELARLRILALPRPELAWDWVTAFFPGRRTWIVPDMGEAFDDMKAAWLRERGDDVLRLEQHAETDGRHVRALLRRDDPAVAEHLPAPVAHLIARWRAEGRWSPARPVSL